MDDLCLAYMLRGYIESSLGELADAESSLREVFNNEQDIALDHYIAPYSRVELANILLKRTCPSVALSRRCQVSPTQACVPFLPPLRHT